MHRGWSTAALVVTLVSCGSDDAPPPAVSSGGSSPTTTGGSSTTDDPSTSSTTATTGTTTGFSEECRACWTGACPDESEACFEEPACSCRLQCSDVACEMACDPSPAAVDLLRCVADASVGPCADLCADACDVCVAQACRPQFDACIGTEVCQCKFRCDDDTTCVAACGADDPAYDALQECILSATECIDDCT